MARYRTPILSILVAGLVLALGYRYSPMSRRGGANPPAVYYWRTVFAPDSSDFAFLRAHRVGRIYMRVFDVTSLRSDPTECGEAVPNATLAVPAERWEAIRDSLAALQIEVVPVVYLTGEALADCRGYEGRLAGKIFARARAVCSYNGWENPPELQIDCDWTSTSRESFFTLCDSLRSLAHRRGMLLSSTIRLHQLRQSPPPADRGVLMVYNTGAFRDVNTANSIIDTDDIEPYLRHLHGYRLPLEVAYPAYGWQLLFRGPWFRGLVADMPVADSTLFAREGENRYRALAPFEHHGRNIHPGDIVRTENASPEVVCEVKRRIEQHLHGRPHGNILYHLDQSNLRSFTPEEIDEILAPRP